MLKSTSRRRFLQTAPLVAAVSLTLNDELFASTSSGKTEQTSTPTPKGHFQVFTAQTIADASKALQATPGNKNLVDPSAEQPFGVVLTVETGKSAKEFEWHEGRDHILQVLDGSTVYELGGTPKNAHSTKPGEWLAPECVGSTKLTLKKGDMLVIPRNTPHKRSTEGSVTFTLISPAGMFM